MQQERVSRDQWARRRRQALTPAARLAAFVRLQRACMQELRASPAGWRTFLQRNLRRRAVDGTAHAR